MDYRGRLWKNYVFIPSDNAIVLLAPGRYEEEISLNKILIVTNVTTNEIIYQPQIDGKGMDTFEFPYLKLEYDCSSMDKRDELQILVETDYADFNSLRTVAEARNQQTLVGILKTLLKIEKQLEIITDEQVAEEDISGPGMKRK